MRRLFLSSSLHVIFFGKFASIIDSDKKTRTKQNNLVTRQIMLKPSRLNTQSLATLLQCKAHAFRHSTSNAHRKARLSSQKRRSHANSYIASTRIGKEPADARHAPGGIASAATVLLIRHPGNTVELHPSMAP
jgi:hypothetical protein